MLLNETGWSQLSALPGLAAHHHYISTDSTNTCAKNISILPPDKMILLTALTQTCGKGQRNNTFFSSISGNIYTSIICPVDDIGNHFHYNRSLCLAIAETLQNFLPDIPVSIKWPNDIYVHNKKICGILLESTPNSNRHIILGFGINVNMLQKDFPVELKNTATSLAIETGKTFSCPSLLTTIYTAFLNNLNCTPDILHPHYTSRLFRLGYNVRIAGHIGIFSGVMGDGRFVLNCNNEMMYFSSGSPEFLS